MENKRHTRNNEQGWNPNVQDGEAALTEEERSLEIGQAGQFALGGYYNQQSVTHPKRRPIDDDDVAPPGRH